AEPPAAAPPAPAPPKVAVAPKPPPVEQRPAAPEAPPPKVAVAPKAPPVEQRPTPAPPAATPPREAAPATAPGRRETAAFHGEVYFGYNSANLGNKAATLDRAVRWLTDSTDVHVVIEGYADPTGTREGNMILGHSRAESVRDYLAAAGIDQGRMEVVSYGDTRLKYGRTDSRNRRVAIVKK
ncbi:MAG TPA: OmpA family protein, partial [Kofleriaceae bacterium]|nr:OmpA family protein [Kofleriaceae bacterium]